MRTNLSPRDVVYQARIDEYEMRARSTGNLVYVWMAIAQAHMAGFPMPEWCSDQIKYWSIRLYEIAHLLDPDKDFDKHPNEEDEVFAERLSARWAKRELSPEEALGKAKALFGFSGQGWNAFTRVMIDEDATRHLSAAAAGALLKKRIQPINADSIARVARRRRQIARKLRDGGSVK